MKSKLMYCILAILIIGIISLANADTVSLKPIDDMYTDPNGTQAISELWVANWPGCGGHYERIMLKFDLSELAGQTIDSATLNLYKFFTAPDGSSTPTNFYAITQPWDEDTWNHTQPIQYDNTVWASQLFTSQLGWYDTNITNLIRSWIDETVTNYGLVIIANSGYKFSKFYSKEYSNPNLHPYLEVTYTAGAVDDENFEMPLFLSQNYPNPFSTSTIISFNIHRRDTENAEIKIYNIRGQLVKEFKRQKVKGKNNIEWDGTDEKGRQLPSGIYFYKLNIKNSPVKKMLLLR